MSTHQLAARIQQMEATQQTRDQRPSQARNRAAKLARYRDELAPRTARQEQTEHDAARPATPIRCSAPGCSSLAVSGIGSPRPHCGYPAHTPQAQDALQRQREAVARNQADTAELPTVNLQPHPAPTIAPPAKAARPTPPRPAAAELSALDKAVEKLVRQHTSGAVIDAAWNAAHRLFVIPK